jgi:hypothetical protein
MTSIGVTLLQAAGHADVRVVGRSIWSPDRSSLEKSPGGGRSVNLSIGAAPALGDSPAVKAAHGTVTGAGRQTRGRAVQPAPGRPAAASPWRYSPFSARFTFGGHTPAFTRSGGHCWIAARYDACRAAGTG